MKKVLSLLCVVVLGVVFVTPAAAQNPTVTFVNPPPGGILELAVGESYTFEVQISSDQPFLIAQMSLNQFFPGRSVHADGFVVAQHGSEATLTLTVTGKKSTAALPDGVAPVSLVVGVRYSKTVVVNTFDFGIVVQ